MCGHSVGQILTAGSDISNGGLGCPIGPDVLKLARTSGSTRRAIRRAQIQPRIFDDNLRV